MTQPKRKQGVFDFPGRCRGLWCCALLCLTGCNIYPETPKRSINELYFEALAAAGNTPEVSLGMNPSVQPPTAPQSRAESAPRQLRLPDESAPQEVLPPAVPPPPAEEAPFSDPLPVSPTGHHAGSSAEYGRPVTDTVDSVGEWLPPVSTTTEIRAKDSSTVVSTVSYEDSPLITEIFEDTDVRQALQSIAMQAGATVIVDEKVGGIVTTLIEDEPLETALRKVTLPLGLIYRQTEEGEYLVGLPDPDSALFGQLSERRHFQPTHLSAEELLSVLTERDQRFVQIIAKRNRMIIQAPPETADQIVEELQRNDMPIPQVELEAIVCVISPDKGFRSGLDWSHALRLNDADALRFGLTGLAFSGAASGAGLSNAFSDFAVTSAFVRLLAQEGYISIRAAPRVTARDGEQAQISITRQSFFSTQPQSGNQFFRQEIEQVEAGIQLDITPVIRGSNITIKIEKAEVSEDIRTSEINSEITENPFPQINRRTVSTTVDVPNGETIVIGGLVQRQTVNRIAKIPVLGSAPGVGRLFQTLEQTEQDAEVVIFISPRIIGTTCPPLTTH